MKDIYFEKEYAQLYETIEQGQCEEYIFTHPLGTIHSLFIKREIPIKLDGHVFYDLVTPYGYGGPHVVEGKKEEIPKLVKVFWKEFGEFCCENNIVSELVRFHPILKNHLDFAACYDLVFKRSTIQTRLESIDDPILTEYSPSCRRDIRHGLKNGVEYRILLHPTELTEFKKLYYSTMKRNAAETVYYFDDAYFQNCIERLTEQLVVVEVTYHGNIIGMSLNFFNDDYIHVHLTGTCQEYHHLAPAYILQYALALWGKQQGKKLIHHGGGRTSRADDTLYLFKKKFGRHDELEYYIGQKIWDRSTYERLEQAAHLTNDRDRFPAYRSRQSHVSTK